VSLSTVFSVIAVELWGKTHYRRWHRYIPS
jgi:hypothetical protein